MKDGRRVHIPESLSKAIVLGGLGAGLGAGLGFYLFGRHPGYFFHIAMMTTIGMSFGWIGALTFSKKITLARIRDVEAKALLLLASLSFLLAFAGLVGFFKTGNAIGIIGTFFFVFCGMYLLWKRKANSSQ